MSEPITTQNLVDKFWECVPSVWRQTKIHIRRIAFDKFQMSVEQFQVLRRIRNGTTSVSSLAEASGTGSPSVSKVVDALVRRGFVTRSQDSQDRRKIPLALTSEGQHVLQEIFSEAEAWLTTRFDELNNSQRKSFLEGLDALNKSFTTGGERS